MKRLESLDAFRGFDMMFIMGFSSVLVALCCLFPDGAHCFLARQMEHAAWDGFRFMDTVFPTFLFIAGVSWPFSYASQLEKGRSKTQIYAKIVRRAVVLFLLGLVVNGFLETLDFRHARYCSVLGRIGLAWMISAILYINLRPSVRAAVAAALLVGYYLLLRYVPAPDAPAGAGVFSLEGNIVGYVDRRITPGSFYQGTFDPEGLLSNIPAVVTAMLGVFTGEFVRKDGLSGERKTLAMLCSAALLAGAGLLWSIRFPINKALWTSSFTLLAGGYALAAFAIFYYIIDVKGYRKWAFPLRVIGLNSITTYVARCFIAFGVATNALLGGVMRLLPSPWARLVYALGYFALNYLLVYFLYKKKIFLKV